MKATNMHSNGSSPAFKNKAKAMKNAFISSKYSIQNQETDWFLMMRQNLSHVMRNPAFCIYENKDANQLCRSAAQLDQHLYFTI